jgi:hypothetical protein
MNNFTFFIELAGLSYKIKNIKSTIVAAHFIFYSISVHKGHIRVKIYVYTYTT